MEQVVRMQLLNDAVETIWRLLRGQLPAPEKGRWQAGVGPWHYKQVPVGGVLPPGGRSLRLWQLETERGLLLFVAPYGSSWAWRYQHAPGTLKAYRGPRPKGDLPLVFATTRTPREPIAVQVGIWLWRQGWKDAGFERWLLDWVRLRSSAEQAGAITARLLKEYHPGTTSPATYVRLCARKRPESGGETRVQRAARELGMTEQGLYKALERIGAYEEMVKTECEGGVVIKRVRRRYLLDEEVLSRLHEERERSPRRLHALLVKAVAERRRVGIRAAQRWVKRRQAQGKSIEDITREILGCWER